MLVKNKRVYLYSIKKKVYLYPSSIFFTSFLLLLLLGAKRARARLCDRYIFFLFVVIEIF
jgi:hypothetical protein